VSRRPPTPGTAAAALTHRRFRAVFFGGLVSNTGSWMQNVTLAAWTFTLTGSETFVSLVVFAQLGPLLLFTLIGGTLADMVDRRRLLLVVAVQQSAFALALAVLATQDDPSRIGILACVLAIGIGQAINAPTFTSILPTLVPRSDLPGAISLQSVNLNASRVIGPAIGGVILGLSGPAAVFVVNAVSFSAIFAVVYRLRFPALEVDPNAETGLRRVLGGFTVARNDAVVGRSLATMALFSFFCLPFVTQMPAIAERNLGIAPESVAYGTLYAAFALGSLGGALSVGTVLAGRPLALVVRGGLTGFAVTMAAFAVLRNAAAAYVVVAVLGVFYFATVTALSTVVQSRITDVQRGRVMALWIMAFGGTVPVGGLVFGPMMELTSVTAVMLVGAVVAAGLVAVARVSGPAPDTAPA
jgi:predicted MFS family arabinose efflux permease